MLKRYLGEFKPNRIKDRRVYFLIPIVALGLIFSGYKALDGLFGAPESDSFQNAPPAIFAQSPPMTLIESSRVEQPRLPDTAYLTSLKSMKTLVGRAATFQITRAELVKAGMSDAQARQSIDQVQQLKLQVPSGSGGSASAATIDDVKGTSAALSSEVSYNLGGGAPLRVTFAGIYQVQGNTIKLDNFQVQVGALAGGGSAPAETP